MATDNSAASSQIQQDPLTCHHQSGFDLEETSGEQWIMGLGRPIYWAEATYRCKACHIVMRKERHSG